MKKQEKKTPEVLPAAAASLLEEDISPMSFKSGMSAFLPGISVEEEEDVAGVVVVLVIGLLLFRWPLLPLPWVVVVVVAPLE